MHGWEWRPRAAGACVRNPGPDFGAHNGDILRELGVDKAEQKTLEAEGVIASRPIGIPPLPWEKD